MSGNTGSEPQNLFEGILPKVMQVIRASSGVAAQDVNFYKSLDGELAKQLDHSGKDLLSLVNSFVHMTSADSRSINYGKENIVSEISWKPISNILDNVFEKIDIEFDKCARGRANETTKTLVTYLEDGNTVDNSNTNSGKKLAKPQLKFRVPIDNSEPHSFKPKITTKPNSLKSFEDSTKIITPNEPSISGDGRESLLDPPYYPHPYEYEIDNHPYPESILSKSDPIPSKDWATTEAIWVDTVEKLNEMISSLASLTEIAVDLEHHDYRTYYGLVSLMQISNREQDWIVDTLALRDDLEPLNIIFTNPNIIKVFHGAFMDIIWLQRDLGLYIVSLFDTYHASKKLGFPKFSLAYLLETFANFKTSKKYQLADWRIRPLLKPMLAYARSDTHFLLNIFDQLKNKLLDHKEQNKLQEVLYESRKVAKRRFEFTQYRPVQLVQQNVSCPIMSANPSRPYESLMYQYNVPFDRRLIVEELYNWRDSIAREHDESVRYIMSNQVLVSLAALNKPDGSSIGVKDVVGASSYISEFVRSNAQQLADLIQQSLERIQDINDWEPSTNENNIESIEIYENGQINKNKLTYNQAAFDSLIQQNEDNEDLINDYSKLFSEILTKQQDQFSMECNLQTKTLVSHNKDSDYQGRVKYITEEFRTLEELSQSESTKIRQQYQEQEQQQSEPVAVTPAETKPPGKDIDPNEVISLRQRKPKAQVAKPQEQTKEATFDYGSADKIMIDTKDRRKQKKNEKKRSFDPYSKESEGPQASKRQRKINSGKTSTFGNKRR